MKNFIIFIIKLKIIDIKFRMTIDFTKKVLTYNNKNKLHHFFCIFYFR